MVGVIFWLCCKNTGRNAMGVKSHLLFSLGGHSKQAGDERNLPCDVPLVHPLHLSLPKHVHGFVGCVRTENTGSNKMCWALLARHPSVLGHQHHGLQSVQPLTEHLALLHQGNLLLHGSTDTKELAHFIEGSTEA